MGALCNVIMALPCNHMHLSPSLSSLWKFAESELNIWSYFTQIPTSLLNGGGGYRIYSEATRATSTKGWWGAGITQIPFGEFSLGLGIAEFF